MFKIICPETGFISEFSVKKLFLRDSKNVWENTGTFSKTRALS